MARYVWALLGVLVVVTAAPIAGQLPIDTDPGRSERTRADLERLLAQAEEALLSPAYSESTKRQVRADAQRIRERLEQGDFRLGDRIVLSVEGEPDLPDTLAVQAGPMISLPLFGDISLAGVLRSEIEEHLTTELGRYIREPVVRARGLMRVSIQGAVRTPGFYVVPADMLLSEALMVAGGPAPNADLEDLRVERGSVVLAEGDNLQEAMRLGRTLDQLNLQAGDQITMPDAGGGVLSNIGVITGLVGSVSFIIFRLLR